jgi:tetratricopeptide (TPR) repeat protein
MRQTSVTFRAIRQFVQRVAMLAEDLPVLRRPSHPEREPGQAPGVLGAGAPSGATDRDQGAVGPPPEYDRAAPAADSGGRAADALVAEAMQHVQRRRWGRAQRVLEAAVREGAGEEALQLLDDVRTVRRCLRQLDRWPRDPQLHLELGRRYFSLELGDEALDALSQAVALQSDLAEGHVYLALEHLFRGEHELACRCWERAKELNPSLPAFDVVREQFTLANQRAAEEGEAGTLPDRSSRTA